MKKQFIFSTLLMSLFIWACAPEKKAPEAVDVELISHTFSKSAGRDCAKMDSVHNHCATIDMSWPVVESGSDALKTSVNQWSTSFLAGLLSPEMDETTAAKSNLEELAQGFLNEHETWSKDATESPLGEWVAEAKDSVVLNDGKYLTLQINAYVFRGGAHGTPITALASFDVATGKQLTWAELVNDEQVLNAFMEEKFRQARPEIFKEGFEFDETFPFMLPQSFGFTAEGLYCFYSPYEVTPYALGSTSFVVPFEELGDKVKLKK